MSQERIREARDVYRTGVEIKRAENQRRHSRPEPTHERISFEKLALDCAERSACFGRLFERDLVAGNNHRPEPNRDQKSALKVLESKGGKIHLNLCGERICMAAAEDSGNWTRNSDDRPMFISEGY